MKKRVLAAPFLFTALAFGDATPPHKKLPKAPEGATVTRDDDGTCWVRSGGHCPPNVHCNPPPPRQVECPPDKKGDKK
jgi:hypothetical protein